MANCLFCAVSVPPTFLIENGKVSKVKNGKGGVSVGIPLQLADKDLAVHDEIKAFFVLKNILKIPDEVLCEFLALCDGDSCPEHWVNVCEECGKLVNQYYDCTKGISKLERRLLNIDRLLRRKINESKKSNDEEEKCGPIWKRVRVETLKGFSFEEAPNEGQFPVNNVNNKEDHLHQEGQQVKGNSSQSSNQNGDLENEASEDSFPSTPERQQGPIESSDDASDADNDKDSGCLGSTSSGTNKVNEKTGKDREDNQVQNEQGQERNNLNENNNGESNTLEKEKESTRNKAGGGASSSSTSQGKAAIFVDLVTDDEAGKSRMARKSVTKASPDKNIAASTSKVLVSCLKTSKKQDKSKTFKKKALKNGPTAKNEDSSFKSSSSTQEVQARTNTGEICSEAPSAELGQAPLVQNRNTIVAPTFIENTTVTRRPPRPATPRPPPAEIIDIDADDVVEERGTSVNSIVTPESLTGTMENQNFASNELEQVRNETESSIIIIPATEATQVAIATTSFPPSVQEQELTITTSVPPCTDKEKHKKDKTDKEESTTQEEKVVTFTTKIIVTDNHPPSNVEGSAVPSNLSEAAVQVADNDNGKSSNIQSELLDLEKNEHFQNVMNQPIGGTQMVVDKETEKGKSSVLNLLAASEENLASPPQPLNCFEVNGGESELNSTQSETIVNPPASSSHPGTPSLTLNHAAMIEAKATSVIPNFVLLPEILREFALAPYNFGPPQIEPVPSPHPTLPIVPPPGSHVSPPPPLLLSQPPPTVTISNEFDSNLNLLASVTLEEAELRLNQQPNLTPIPPTFSQVQIQSSTFIGDSISTLLNGQGSNASGNEAEHTSCPSTISTFSTPMVLSFNGGVVEDANLVQQSGTNVISPEMPNEPTKPILFLIRQKPKEVPLLVSAPPVEEATVLAAKEKTLAAAVTPVAGGARLLEIAEQEPKRPAILRKIAPKDLTSPNLRLLSPPKTQKTKRPYVPKPKHSTPRKNWREDVPVFMCHHCPYKTEFAEDLERHLHVHVTDINKDEKAEKKSTLAESATLFLLPRQAPAPTSISQFFNQTRNVEASTQVSSTPLQITPPQTAPPQMALSQTAPPQTTPPQTAQGKPETPYTLGSNGLFICSKCPAVKTSSMYMQIHVKLHSGSDSNYIFCKTCNYPVLTEKLKQHRSLRHLTTHPTDPTPNFSLSPFMKKSKPGDDNKCGQCPATFKVSEMLDAHLKLHFGGSAAIVCPEPSCGWYVLREGLTHHQGRRHPENHAKCVHCQKRFSDDHEHLKHLRIHEVGQLCDECGWLGKSLKHHKTRNHPKDGASNGQRVRGNGKQKESPETSVPSSSPFPPLPSSSSTMLSPPRPSSTTASPPPYSSTTPFPSPPPSAPSSPPPTTTENVEEVVEQEKTPEANSKCDSEFSTETALQVHENKEHVDLNVNEEVDDDGRVQSDACGLRTKHLTRHKPKCHPPNGVQGNENETPTEAEACSSSSGKRVVKRKQKADDDIQEVEKKPEKKAKLAEKKEAKIGNKKGKPVARKKLDLIRDRMQENEEKKTPEGPKRKPGRPRKNPKAEAVAKTPLKRKNIKKTKTQAVGKTPPKRKYKKKTKTQAVGKTPPKRKYKKKTKTQAVGKTPPKGKNVTKMSLRNRKKK
ncbi:unnamed protein product [Orchesella dallaii]|uniref:C2H2-type domain-containing protein n=1 Tax=Orchesella dallaii TaxID=48710 RepID=A0ABP1R268_9HEXA